MLVLPRRGRAGEEEEDVPWQPDLEEHLHIEQAEHARIELRSHEKIVQEVA